jgi:hypothetical protein
MNRPSDPTTVPRQGRTLLGRFSVVAAAAFLWLAFPQISAAAEDDVLQQAINYVFTGAIDPKDAPEITDRKSCVVVVPDPKWKRFVRYYLPQLGLDDPRIDSTYSGRQARYQLDAQSDQLVVEYLSADKKTVVNGYKSAQIPLPGDIDRTKKAMQLIAARCKRDDAPKLPF